MKREGELVYGDMDDLRLEWLRKQIYLALEITEYEVFDEFISRDSNEYDLSVFLSHSITAAGPKSVAGSHPHESAPREVKCCPTAFFYKSKILEEVEEEIEVPIGKPLLF